MENTKSVSFLGFERVLPDWVNYIAADEDGEVFGYEFLPSTDREENGWEYYYEDSGRYRFLCFVSPSTNRIQQKGE